MIVLAVGCDPKGNGSDTGEINSSGSDGSDGSDGTDGASSTDGSASDPGTSGGSSASSVGTSVGSDTATATTGEEPGTTGLSVGTSVGTDPTDTDGPPPPEPVPCEGEAVALDVASLAYTYAQVPPQPDPTGGSSGTGGDPMIDPDTLYVRLSSQVATCADPQSGLDCGPNWSVTIVIPPAYQAPGLYQLLGPEVLGTAMETGVDEGGGQCSFGGGSISATFQLISIDDETVTGRLCHVQWPFFDIKDLDLEGSFTAPRCE